MSPREDRSRPVGGGGVGDEHHAARRRDRAVRTGRRVEHPIARAPLDDQWGEARGERLGADQGARAGRQVGGGGIERVEAALDEEVAPRKPGHNQCPDHRSHRDQRHQGRETADKDPGERSQCPDEGDQGRRTRPATGCMQPRAQGRRREQWRIRRQQRPDLGTPSGRDLGDHVWRHELPGGHLDGEVAEQRDDAGGDPPVIDDHEVGRAVEHDRGRQRDDGRPGDDAAAPPRCSPGHGSHQRRQQHGEQDRPTSPAVDLGRGPAVDGGLEDRERQRGDEHQQEALAGDPIRAVRPQEDRDHHLEAALQDRDQPGWHEGRRHQGRVPLAGHRIDDEHGNDRGRRPGGDAPGHQAPAPAQLAEGQASVEEDEEGHGGCRGCHGDRHGQACPDGCGDLEVREGRAGGEGGHVGDDEQPTGEGHGPQRPAVIARQWGPWAGLVVVRPGLSVPVAEHRSVRSRDRVAAGCRGT